MTRRAFGLLIGASKLHDRDEPLPSVEDAIERLDAFLSQRFGWPSGDTPFRKRLVGDDARRNRVETAFRHLKKEARSGDLVVIAFSGHGVPDGETEHRYQAWALFGGGQGGAQIGDLVLATHLIELPRGVEVVVINDCCYGEGLFTIGADSSSVDSTLESMAARKAEHLHALWKAKHPDAEMICFSAAATEEIVVPAGKSELVRRIVGASTPNARYADVGESVEAHPSAGARFHVDFRPRELSDRFAFARGRVRTSPGPHADPGPRQRSRP